MTLSLSHSISRSSIQIGAKALGQLPALAAKAMEAIGVWSQIHADQALLLATILKADPFGSAVMFQTMNDPERLSEALRATARSVLRSWEQILLAAVLEAARASRLERDQLVTHLWGSAEDVPHTLLLLAPVLAAHPETHDAIVAKPGYSRGPENYDQVLAYDERAIETVLARARGVAEHIRSLRLVIEQGSESSRLWLIRQPEIQQSLPRFLKGAGLEVEEMLVSH